MNRSALRELAGIVLVASETEADRNVVGMTTVSEAEALGRIGLIAVLENFQGRGVGSLLMGTAHRWMIGRGAKQATVVTQLANVPACKLYERLGYHLVTVQHYYHFWTQI
jgi:ribosomal protein S18 acetylase RimI-like enzyme